MENSPVITAIISAVATIITAVLAYLASRERTETLKSRTETGGIQVAPQTTNLAAGGGQIPQSGNPVGTPLSEIGGTLEYDEKGPRLPESP